MKREIPVNDPLTGDEDYQYEEYLKSLVVSK